MAMNFFQKVKQNKELQVLLAIIFAGALLRLLPLTREGFWYDEALTALSMKMPFIEMLKDRFAAGHSPLYFTGLYIWSRLFGTSEFPLRLPSAIASVVSIYYFWLLGRKLFSDRKAAVLSAAFFTLSALNIYFAQEARMYSMSVLFTVMSFYYLLEAPDRPGIKDWICYIASTSALLYLSASNILVIFAQIAYVLIKRRKLADFFLSLAVTCAAYLPMVFFYFGMKKLGFIEWVPPITINTFLEVFYGWGFRPVPVAGAKGSYAAYLYFAEFLSVFMVGLIIIFGAAASAYGSFRKKKLEKDADTAIFLLLWLVLPILLALLYSWLKQPIFGPKRYLIMLSPAYYLLIGLGLSRITWRNLKYGLSYFIIAMFIVSLGIFYATPTREDWRGAVSAIDREFTQGEVIFGDIATGVMYQYYGRHADAIICDVRYINKGIAGKGWLLMRTKDFRAMFGNGDLITRHFKNKAYRGHFGLELYHITGQAR
jgi:mannosyltransferase